MTTVHYPAVIDRAGQPGEAAAPEFPRRTARVTVTLDESLLAAIDEVAVDRAGFLAEAAREKLAHRWKQEGQWDPKRPYPYFGLA